MNDDTAKVDFLIDLFGSNVGSIMLLMCCNTAAIFTVRLVLIFSILVEMLILNRFIWLKFYGFLGQKRQKSPKSDETNTQKRTVLTRLKLVESRFQNIT